MARRLVIFASEDVGNAEPQALPLAVAAFEAVDRIGLPEGASRSRRPSTFLATAPKSNASYVALGRASAEVAKHGSPPVPLHLRNAPTPLMKRGGLRARRTSTRTTRRTRSSPAATCPRA